MNNEMAKMDLPEYILKIEREYNVEKIRYDGITLWPYLRISMFSSGVSVVPPKNPSMIGRDRMSRSAISVLKRIKSVFMLIIAILDNCFRHGLVKIWNSKNKPVFFTDNLEVRFFDGVAIDKIAHEVMHYYHNDVIPIVHFVTKRSICAFRDYVDYRFLLFGIHRSGKYDKNKLDGRDIWNRIVIDSGTDFNIDIDQLSKTIYKSICYFIKLWKRICPTGVYVNCYYSMQKMAAICAAKKCGIPVIELQHGILGKRHIAYYAEKDVGDESYPDYFFAFGEKFGNQISPSIYKPDRIKLVGSYYLEMNKTRKNKCVAQFRKKYPKRNDEIIAIIAGESIGSYRIDDRIIAFCERIHMLSEDIRFVYLPRDIRCAARSESSKGVYLEEEMDIYQCMLGGDFLITSDSTCFLEALFYGRTSILIDFPDGNGRQYKENLCDDIDYVRLVDNPESAVVAIHELMQYSEDDIMKAGELFFVSDHKRRIENAIRDIRRLTGGEVRSGQ